MGERTRQVIVDNKKTLIPLGIVIAMATFLIAATAEYTGIKGSVADHEKRIVKIENTVEASLQRIEAKLGTAPK